MIALLRHWFLAILLAILPGVGVAAEWRVLIVREDSVVSRQAAEILERDLLASGWMVGSVLAGTDRFIADHSENEQFLVALGARAFASALRHAGGKTVIAALLAQSSLEESPPGSGDRWSAILLDQPSDRWINLLQTAFPAIQHVGLLVGPANQKSARLMERRLADRRLTLSTESISLAEEVVPAIERLIPRMGVLLALPDPLVHNRNTVQPLLLTTYRSGIPVVAYSESYQQAGAVLALYSSVPQIVAQITETLQQAKDGRSLPNLQPPRYFTVGVNTAVARSLGLSLPSSGELSARLRSLGQ
jgi:putative tryptophan/tyrosine transport system substrate-binding protein